MYKYSRNTACKSPSGKSGLTTGSATPKGFHMGTWNVSEKINRKTFILPWDQRTIGLLRPRQKSHFSALALQAIKKVLTFRFSQNKIFNDDRCKESLDARHVLPQRKRGPLPQHTRSQRLHQNFPWWRRPLQHQARQTETLVYYSSIVCTTFWEWYVIPLSTFSNERFGRQWEYVDDE